MELANITPEETKVDELFEADPSGLVWRVNRERILPSPIH